MKSLKYRITLWYGTFAIILTVMMLFSILLIASYNTDVNVRDNLQITVNAVADKAAHSNPQSLDTVLTKEIDKKIIGIYSKNKELLIGLQPEFSGVLPSFQDNEIQNCIYDGKLFYTFDRLIHCSGQDIWVRGFVPALTPKDTVNLVARQTLFLMPITMFLMLAGGYIIICHALKPLHCIIQEADRIGNGDDLSIQIPVPDSHDEISFLAQTFNHMLSRLQTSFQRERQFSQDVSHELRTPISVILSQCELEADGDMTLEEYSQAFSMVRRQARKMHLLTNELLQLCRLESGHQKLDSSLFCLSELVAELVEEQRLLHPEIIYQCQIAPSVSITGDYQLLGRAVTNLLDNAWKYGKSPVSVHLYTESDKICLSVHDHGSGISPENLNQIWNRFYQVNASRTSDSGTSGFGLGLSIVKQIVTLHGGKITVQSNSEEGTTFLIFL